MLTWTYNTQRDIAPINTYWCSFDWVHPLLSPLTKHVYKQECTCAKSIILMIQNNYYLI